MTIHLLDHYRLEHSSVCFGKSDGRLPKRHAAPSLALYLYLRATLTSDVRKAPLFSVVAEIRTAFVTPTKGRRGSTTHNPQLAENMRRKVDGLCAIRQRSEAL